MVMLNRNAYSDHITLLITRYIRMILFALGSSDIVETHLCTRIYTFSSEKVFFKSAPTLKFHLCLWILASCLMYAQSFRHTAQPQTTTPWLAARATT